VFRLRVRDWYECVVDTCDCVIHSLLQIIDSFGTEPAFNYDVYAEAHHLKTQWKLSTMT